MGFVFMPLSSEFEPFSLQRIGKFSSELWFAQNGLNRYGPSSFPSNRKLQSRREILIFANCGILGIADPKSQELPTNHCEIRFKL